MPILVSGDKTDNNHNFEYNHRYLDSIASIFNISSSNAVIGDFIDNQITFTYCYNRNLTNLRNYHQQLSQEVLNILIVNNNNDHEVIGHENLGNCLMFYLTFNTDFYGDLRYISRSLIEGEDFVGRQNLLNRICLMREEIAHNRLLFRTNFQNHQIDNQNLLFNLNNIPQDELLNQYLDIKVGLINFNLHDDLIRKFCKPFKVISKLYSYFHEIDINNIEFNLILNQNNYHAEINIINNLLNDNIYLALQNNIPHDLNDINYIGVSRLCCVMCNVFLVHNNIDHRGNHPIIYNIGLTEDNLLLLNNFFLGEERFVENNSNEGITILNNQDHNTSIDLELAETNLNFYVNELNNISLNQFLLNQHHQEQINLGGEN